MRELKEETGYDADRVLDVSPVIVSDPGPLVPHTSSRGHADSHCSILKGMTNANMKLVTVSVWFEDEIKTPVPNLEPGEHIETRVVPLTELHDKLLGTSHYFQTFQGMLLTFMQITTKRFELRLLVVLVTC